MTSYSHDVVIVGGGIHGVGVAQAAAAAGYRTLILERTAIASGTSRRSSKLIHGGLRYIETAQLRLVRESLRERRILLALAPDLVRRVPFFIPVYRNTARRPWTIGAGLTLYALLGGLTPDMRFGALPRRSWDNLDGLQINELQTVWRYFDGQTDDAALARAVMRSAASFGAELVCPADFVSASRTSAGYHVSYIHEGNERESLCRTLVNATGPWVDLTAQRVYPPPPRLAVDLIQGTHIVLSGQMNQGVYYVEAPADGRAVFVMPWKDRTLVGTTETVYEGDPALTHPLPQEISYLTTTMRHYFPGHNLDIQESFSGLRVLPKGNASPFRRTRETLLLRESSNPARYIAVYGGKLTGYRLTAARILRLLHPALPHRAALADTSRLALTPN